MRVLDIDLVRGFVLVAELASFTRAAEAAGTTQSAMSLKIKRLEERLGRRLVERSPRHVRLSPEGSAFLPRARDLLDAMARAVEPPEGPPPRLLLGISDHVAGPEFPGLLARLARHDPTLALEVRIEHSHPLMDAFDAGSFDAVVVRREGGRRDGEALFRDAFGWYALPSWRPPAGTPLPLVTLSSLCGVRALAARLLDEAAVPWRESFVGGGTAAVVAAIGAGLGVAPLAARIVPEGLVEVGGALGLPPLPPSEVVLHSRVSDARSAAAIRTLAAAFRGTAGRSPAGG